MNREKMIAYNLLSEITNEAVKRIRKENRTIVWYGGRKVLGVVNDCVNIMGGKIDYAIVEADRLDEAPLDYVNSIPLINKHIAVDIRKSEILSRYHIELNQPKPVDKDIIGVLGNSAVYILSSRYSDEMRNLLIGKGISSDNIIILASEDESVNASRKKTEILFEGRRPLSIEEIHKIEYEILKHFRNFCKKNHLRYWLGGGTMLGAIRHKGFIPWDDDVDIFMPDVDYRRFLELYRDSNQYELLNYSKARDYPFFFSKISDKRTVLLHYDYPVEYIMGVYIDIFPLVGYSKDEKERNAQWEFEHLTMAEWYWYKDMSIILGEENIPIVGGNILKKMVLPAFDKSEYVGQVSVVLQKQWVSRKEDFSGYINKRFEKEEFKVPVGYDAHLRERYGNYMELPSEENREVHSFPMYR